MTAVDSISVEFAPPRRSAHLGDQTRVDAMAVARTDAGPLYVVFEVKYADRFNSRVVALGDRYVELASRSGLWRSHDVLAEKRFNQMVRCHALGCSVGLAHDAGSTTVLVVLHHDLDKSAKSLLEDYSTTLVDPANAKAVSLASFVTEMGPVARPLFDRYCDMSASEPAWAMFTGSA